MPQPVTAEEIRLQKSGFDEHLMLFDLEVYGHHANYIRLIVDYWIQQGNKKPLSIIVAPEFMERHRQLVESSKQAPNQTVTFYPITIEEERRLSGNESRFKRLFRRFQEWQLLGQYAAKLNASQCLVMLIDQLQLPAILQRKLPCKTSGIYFQPSFHYQFFEASPKGSSPLLKVLRDKIFIYQFFKHDQLKNLYCLDPYATEAIKADFPNASIWHLPDPIASPEPCDLQALSTFKEKFDLEDKRHHFLLFGNLDQRKGLFQILDALFKLPPTICRQICLVFVGRIDPTVADSLTSKIKTVTEATEAKIVTRFDFVSDEEVNLYFESADTIMALYQNHLGMSGILLWAAAYQKPVISQEFGLMGEIVRQHQLGITVDSSSPIEIAQALSTILTEGTLAVYNPDSAARFSKMHAEETFAANILSHL